MQYPQRPVPQFRSFLQGGFECSTHINCHRKRLDLIKSTQHDRFARSDYRALKTIGIQTVREGARWHLIEEQPEQYDFATLREILDPAREEGIEVILDLFHFGWPEHWDLFSDDFVVAFERYSAALLHFLKQSDYNIRYIAPMNEISFMSWGAGDEGFLYPFAKGRPGEVKRQLVRAGLAAAKLVRKELPDAVLTWPEPAIHIVGTPELNDLEEAEAYRLAQYQAWDMLAGRLHPELGGSPEFLDLLGVNFYDRNQWIHNSPWIPRSHPLYKPFHKMLEEIWHRYRKPIFISETGTEDEGRVDWFHYICDEVETAIEKNLPVTGICLYPIVNHPGWENDRHCHNGLFDYADEEGRREPYQPLAEAVMQRQFDTEPAF